jgi:prepilin-type N-terminal cleavage/methylation domain-containing protein
VNGAPVASEKADIIIPSPDAPLTIGQAENLGFFSGLLDEVAIYNRALSPAEVKNRWSALAPATKPDAEKVGEVRRFLGHQTGVNSVAISPDGRLAATGGQGGPDLSVRLWDMADGHEIRRMDGHGGTVTGVAFSPVVGAWARVPDTDWFLIAELDQSETLAPLRQMLWTFTLMELLVVIAIIGVLIGMLLPRRAEGA